MAKAKAATKRTAAAKPAAKKPAAKKPAATKPTPTKKPGKPAASWLADVTERLALVRTLAEVRAANTSNYTPRDPISAKALDAFEAKHGVTLPVDYRDVVSQLGIGLGHDSGILPLAPYAPTEMPSVTVTVTGSGITSSAGTGARPALGRAAQMDKPFPLTATYSPATPLPLATGQHLYDGCLELADLGCGYALLLAITGPGAGDVWEDLTAGDGAIARLGTFRDWLDHWLAVELCNGALQVATTVAKMEKPKSALAALRRAQPRLEALAAPALAATTPTLAEARLLAAVGHTRLTLGDRDGALAVLARLPGELAPALRQRIYADDLAAARDERKPALELATHVAREVRVALAGNPKTPAKTIAQLTTDADPEVRSRAARHPNASADVLARVARDGLALIARGALGVETAAVIELAVRNPAAPVALLDEAATAALASDARTAAIVLRGCALAAAATPALRARLATSPWPEVRHALAARQDTDPAILRALAADPCAAIRAAIAGRRDTPPAVLAQLAADPAKHVRDAVAGNPNTPPAQLAELAARNHGLYYLARNPGLPAPLVTAFGLLRGYDAAKRELDPADVPTPRAWVDQADMDGRSCTLPAVDVLDAATVRHWSAPVQGLWSHLDDNMGPYNMAGRPWLSPELIERLASDPYGYARDKIAERSDVDPRVLARLVGDPFERVRASVAGNPRTTLPEVRRAVSDAADVVREGAAMHPQLPADLRARLLADPAPYTRRGVARSPNATVAELTKLAADPSEDVRRWVPWNAATPRAVLDKLTRDADETTAGRAAFRIAVDAYRATLAP